MSPQLTIDLTDPEVAKHFAECAPGDQKTITFTVESKDDASVSGSIDSVEGDYAEPEGEDAEEKSEKGGGKSMKHSGMPKGLTLVISGGR